MRRTVGGGPAGRTSTGPGRTSHHTPSATAATAAATTRTRAYGRRRAGRPRAPVRRRSPDPVPQARRGLDLFVRAPQPGAQQRLGVVPESAPATARGRTVAARTAHAAVVP
ncbi:hypothetical protein PQR15_20315 [Streptomyces lydicus]|nr:hypothetical protein [Streptomyces lydicus]